MSKKKKQEPQRQFLPTKMFKVSGSDFTEIINADFYEINLNSILNLLKVTDGDPVLIASFRDWARVAEYSGNLENGSATVFTEPFPTGWGKGIGKSF